MTEQHTVFTKKHDDVMEFDKKAILEELNLPPVAVTFIRKNLTIIKVSLVMLVLGIVAWEGYGNYRLSQLEKSSAMLHDALNAKTDNERLELLTKLQNEYGRSTSAIWAEVEMGHVAFTAKNYDEALSHYQAALDKLSMKSPLFPLVQLNIAAVYESIGESEKTEAAYRKLLEVNGFEGIAYLGLGRVYEKNGDAAQALEMFENYLALPSNSNASGITKELVAEKVAFLQEGPVPVQKAE